MTVDGATHSPSTSPAPLPGTASLAVRALIDGPRRLSRVIAVFPSAIYLQLSAASPEPRVLALVTADAVRLPNGVVVSPIQRRGAPTAATPSLLAAASIGERAYVGEGAVQVGRIRVLVRRWWDPSPVLGPLSAARLVQGCAALDEICSASSVKPGLEGHPAPARLAACCSGGDLAGAVEVAEHLVGLGPGLTPSGDDMLGGLLLALRLLGGAIRGGTRAVWLADWLGAAVTGYATDRTTSLSATLLHCAAHGQAAAEVVTVLRAFAAQEPAMPAVTRLLTVGHTSGADLAWGLAAGCRAALALSVE